MKAKVIKTGEIVDVYHESQHGQITNIYKESVLVNGRMWTEDELDFCVKANEAPEKIYMPNELLSEEWQRHIEGEDTEYIRADAFIEKAADYFNSQLYDWVSITNPDQRSCANVIPKRDFIEDFRNYMKGE